ncbi:hypothetical protein CORC01_13794 [Colletotrichum orchidophilum]|uniref:Uncharacterized protein n=1 Tax=Colletotrichum orchidophilum TaxID=1209926 RepID=A0A1G4AP10_9PEZI|nr:uncharacterized protein CORC01_13794 [Colletotrichum orchidophilum]OHE90909.1 hypothetical protein CORC01_13794 [Colletotrichum orchidophilum]
MGSWIEMEKAISSFIAVDLVDEYQPTPSLIVEAYEIERDCKKPKPIVFISYYSQPCGKRMAKTLQQNGVLETESGTFRGMFCRS